MKLTFLYLACLTMLLGISCNQLSGEEQRFDALMQEVIDVHDEVMPKMGEISTLIKYLDPKIDTTQVGQSHARAQQDLKDAYDFMMKWMSDFSDKFPHDPDNEKMSSEKLSSQMKLLEEEKIEVNKLKDKINSSISNAKKLLEKS